MENIKFEKGKRYKINAYKHDSSIHRAWDEAVFLDQVNDIYIFGNDNTIVTEVNGKKWKTKEAAILFFYKHNWFNVVAQFKDKGIFYYCNIATPIVLDKDTIKYIDYDLDLRVFPSLRFKTLDRNEYNYHKEKMNYSKEIDKIVNDELNVLKDKVRNKEFPFIHDSLKKYLKQYKEYQKNCQNNDK